MKYRGIIKTTLLSSLTVAAALPAVAAERTPTVVELFTSQGCSSCPPANVNLIKLSNRSDVLALSFSVTYWDYLGWKDTYGKPEFTQRQVTYEPSLHQAGPYTPQMVVNGSATAVGNSLPEIQQLISETPPLNGPALALSRDRIEVGAGPETGGADVWLVRYDPQIEAVPVARGENTGSTLQHAHVVRRLERLGHWSGEMTSFTLPGQQPGLKTAVLVQRPNGGAILSAITD
ncbi:MULTISPECIES: DUF1223 domain-containing protein [Rhizobium]|jgi:hypothetical protein|uniref:DUF1223 domain-containing protein n=1 Tax=Rhizobium lusitanum TaxID=293958 RepID=A0A1C3WUP3_9HYPH|nr:DUF1223 domain-containing protein [Rhizobium lusitanum]SCB43762.1 hypothetical protein GA0061101_117132 [Rhizobium lusitanum]